MDQDQNRLRRETEAENAGRLGLNYPAQTGREALANERGKLMRRDSGGGGGVGGFPIFLLPFVLMFCVALWPIAGWMTVVGALVMSILVDLAMSGGNSGISFRP